MVVSLILWEILFCARPMYNFCSQESESEGGDDEESSEDEDEEEIKGAADALCECI